MSSENIYCVYLTTYRGSKLPMFYIGSSTVKRINNGYKGSVSSKKYKNTWNEELKNNPQLFSTKIVALYSSDVEARSKELFFQKKLNVKRSDLYVNESEARTYGFFGRNVAGKNNPMYGKRGSKSPNYGSKRNEKTRKLMSITNSRPMSDEQKKKLSIINTGKKYSEEYKKNMSLVLKGKKRQTVQCPHCGKVGGINGMKRYHYENCKLNVIDSL